MRRWLNGALGFKIQVESAAEASAEAAAAAVEYEQGRMQADHERWTELPRAVQLAS
jgi:hypothetical protein